jgi:hypothetical protein
MTTYKLDPTLITLGKRLDSILIQISMLPLSPPIEELLRQLSENEKGRTCRVARPSSPVARGHDIAGC